MGKSTPAAPPPPDPTVVAKAQGDANIASATAQQRLNMIGTSGPTGTVGYVADPNQPGGYTQTTTLSQPEQQTYDLSKTAQNGALGVANDQLGRVSTALATPLNTSGLPSLQGGVDLSGLNAGAGIQSTFDKGGQLKYSFDPGQAVQGQVGPQDLSAATQQAQQAAYGQAQSRLDPQFAQSENQLRTKLANQGLSQNDTAYATALQNFQQGKNDAYSTAQNQAVTQGNAAAQQLFDQSLQQGTFANSAAGQEYAQNAGQAQFNNTTAGQDYGQNLGAAQFSNTAQQQGFNQQATAAQLDQANAQLQNTARNQGLQEQAYVQNQPINQLTGLLGLGQVSTPGGISYTPSQVGQTDVTGAYALQAQAQQAAAAQAAQSNSGLMGGLFTLGSAALMHSDRRLKTDVKFLRRRQDGVRVYSFRYRAGGGPKIGVMAQELKKLRPDLVVRRADGMLAVNYIPLGAL